MDNFTQNLDKIRQLTQFAGTKQFDEYSKGLKKDGTIDLSESADGSQSIKSKSVSIDDKSQVSSPQINASKVKMSGLPKEILESIEQNPLDVTSEIMGNTSSVLDKLNLNASKRLMVDNKPMNNIVEQVNRQPSPSQIMNEENLKTQSIDYSLIRMIVEDIIKKYASTIVKKVINESKENNKGVNENNNLSVLKMGDKFQFLAENGDLYVANLKFVKNIKK